MGSREKKKTQPRQVESINEIAKVVRDLNQAREIWAWNNWTIYWTYKKYTDGMKVIQIPIFLGDQTMHIYGNFESFPL